ncbi:flagellar assembly protein FliW [Aciduricibacillus chroicocephali]|uniref:Flagellar assembly factor FliW n=1 Tax=Aciduricibacillus chroicocephali TaxID=3054939 RepID=A0ABY9KSU9_9BACI|nr:flagellar assembly protein FliW [Bacillaceae bacterium 44XB]
MQIHTKYLGELTIEEKQIIHFPHGLPGFQEETRFVLMNLPDGGMFEVLQSAETPELAFIVASPYHFDQSYKVEIDEAVQESLEIEQPEDVAIYGIVTIRDPFAKSTINLKAPLLINVNKQLAKQHILTTDHYVTKTPIMKEEA